MAFDGHASESSSICGSGSGGDILSPLAWAEIARSLKLSGRELQIVRGLFNNLTEAAIADELSMSEHTVHIHLNRLFKKLHANTRVQVVLCVIREVILLTLSDSSTLPSICRERAHGRCHTGRIKSKPRSGA